MTRKAFSTAAMAALLLLVPLLLIGCGRGGPEQASGLPSPITEDTARTGPANAASPSGAEERLTIEDVEQAIRRALADMPRQEAGLSRAEVEAMVRTAIAASRRTEPQLTAPEVEESVLQVMETIPQPEPGLTTAEAEVIARSAVAAIPPRSAPAAYTKFFVDNAISRYETQGLEDTLAYYNQVESVDGQWYVFIIDGDDRLIAHPDAQRLGLDLKGWVGTDANGYNFGPEMLSADGSGKWVSYVYRNPETGRIGSDDSGALQLKNAWVVRHEGLLFGSGWYIDADEFTQEMVDTAVRVFRLGGLPGTMAYFASPDNDFAGLRAAIEYYNSADNVEGNWFAFIADENGTIINHYHPEMVGKSLEDAFGPGMVEATAEGNWWTTDDARVWVVRDKGMTFGSGWRSSETRS